MSYNVCITKAVVSPGYDKTEALKFSDSGEAVRFRVGIPHYDANAENNTFWENETVKAFGSVCEQVKKMKLKEGSLVSFVGEKIYDSWEDEETGEIKHASAIKLFKVEYAGSGKKSDSDDDDEDEEEVPKSKPKATAKKGTTSSASKKSAYSSVAGSDEFY
jgi:single-stranded DNA-binding protein